MIDEYSTFPQYENKQLFKLLIEEKNYQILRYQKKLCLVYLEQKIYKKNLGFWNMIAEGYSGYEYKELNYI